MELFGVFAQQLSGFFFYVKVSYYSVSSQRNTDVAPGCRETSFMSVTALDHVIILLQAPVKPKQHMAPPH